jgi:hypothetical protein
MEQRKRSQKARHINHLFAGVVKRMKLLIASFVSIKSPISLDDASSLTFAEESVSNVA